MNNLHRHRGSLIRFKCPLFWYDSRITEQKQARLYVLLDVCRTIPHDETAAATGATPQFGAVALQVLIEGKRLWIWSVEDDVEVLNASR